MFAEHILCILSIVMNFKSPFCPIKNADRLEHIPCVHRHSYMQDA